jgi:hypothetical protein
MYVRYIYDATKMLARQNIKRVLVNLLVAQIVTAQTHTRLKNKMPSLVQIFVL